MKPRALSLLLLLGGSGCVYYNGLWNAHRYAREARKQERAGRPDAAVGSWSLAAFEAESVAAHHPHSGWFPDAVAMAAEGLAGSRDCVAAQKFIDRIPTISRDSAILERGALAQATCALAAGDVDGAETAARPVLNSKDEDRRNRAALLVGRAASQRRAFDDAAAALARSPERAAGVLEILALIAGGQVARADTLCDALVRRKPLEEDWDSIFTAFSAAAGPAVTSRIVVRVLPRTRLTQGERARLYLEDGNRLLASGDPATADQRFLLAAEAAPDSAEADKALVGRLWARVAESASTDSLAAISQDLSRLAADGGARGEARRLQAVLRLLTGPDTTVTGAFRAGEIARDSLYADPLAAALFLEFARGHPTSMFAPKAIVAAMPLSPAHADSLSHELEARYSASPYSLALHGSPSPGYVAAEDSLAQLFGIRNAAEVAVAGARLAVLWSVPQTGRRGPLLDPPDVAEPVRVPDRPNGPRRPTVLPN